MSFAIHLPVATENRSSKIFHAKSRPSFPIIKHINRHCDNTAEHYC